MSDDLARVKAIVITARELSGRDRAAYLSEACGDEAALKAVVEALLAHEVDAPSILSTGGVQITPALLQELGTETAGPLPPAIGPYTPLALLGEGGMGGLSRRAGHADPPRSRAEADPARAGHRSNRGAVRG